MERIGRGGERERERETEDHDETDYTSQTAAIV